MFRSLSQAKLLTAHSYTRHHTGNAPGTVDYIACSRDVFHDMGTTAAAAAAATATAMEH